ncbi:hypothetical protein SAMN04490357_4694 [Streptomyces misionensis]|uniref:Excreted virulence factor EspC, type VII ESX diderm n=1 Tax=Streptomyces misionensis TaxID=67331 RepID=A0A1H5ACQ9_9ACTN|nr:hypothetical protein [Streptomyces misionensis]SED39541.1 hypothetical protein SAMN04490357_4694 [Streptomyces misionensis]
MSWDEWEELKAHAVTRSGSARMQLNHLPTAGGGGSSGGGPGLLKSDRKVWATAGGDITGLRTDVSTALGKLEHGQSGLGDGAGCESAAAQKELFESWKKYVGDVGGRCGKLGGLLERAGRDLSMTDGDVRAGLQEIKSEYRDTEAVGGQTKGK